MLIQLGVFSIFNFTQEGDVVLANNIIPTNRCPHATVLIVGSRRLSISPATGVSQLFTAVLPGVIIDEIQVDCPCTCVKNIDAESVMSISLTGRVIT